MEDADDLLVHAFGFVTPALRDAVRRRASVDAIYPADSPCIPPMKASALFKRVTALAGAPRARILPLICKVFTMAIELNGGTGLLQPTLCARSSKYALKPWWEVPKAQRNPVQQLLVALSCVVLNAQVSGFGGFTAALLCSSDVFGHVGHAVHPVNSTAWVPGVVNNLVIHGRLRPEDGSRLTAAIGKAVHLVRLTAEEIRRRDYLSADNIGRLAPQRKQSAEPHSGPLVRCIQSMPQRNNQSA
jgi:hypothetical protein